MILRVEWVFDKVYLNVERELTTKVMDKLKEHKLFIVQLHEPRFIEDLPESWVHQCAYGQNLECMEVVQCKNCRMNFPWCQKFRDELRGNGFCSYGAKMKGADNETD